MRPVSEPAGPDVGEREGYDEMTMRKAMLVLSMVAAVGLLSGCPSAQERAEAHLKSALELVAAGDVDRATVEFRNVFKLDPANREARMAFADLQEKRDAPAQAYAQYAQVLERDPNDLDALHAAARIAASLGNWPEARTRAAAGLALAPDAPDLLAVKTGADYAEAAASGDETARKKAAAAAGVLLAKSPDTLLLYQIGIDDLMRAQDYTAAATAIDKAIALAPTDKGLYSTRLTVLLAQNDTDAVERRLREMVTLFPDDPSMGATLLRWYVSRKELDKAETYLRDAAGQTGPRTNTARMDLVGFLARYRGPGEAIAELDRIIAETPATPAPADAETAAADEKAARKAAKAGTAPQMVVTLATFRALRASLDFDQGQRDAAIASMQAVLKDAPASDETRRIKVTLARMLFSTGDAVAARALVEEVLAEDAANSDAVKLKATWLIEDDKTDEAVALLRGGLDANPRDAAVMTLLAQAYERLGNRDLLGDMLSQAVAASNKAPEESIRYASFLAADKKYLPAEAVLIDALRLDPGNVAILTPLGQIYLAMEDRPRATSVADRLEEIGGDAALGASRGLRAAILQGQAKTDEVVGYLQGLVTDGDAGQDAQVAILRTYLANGETQKAQAFADDMLTKDPKDPSLRFIDATVKSATGDTKSAEATFRDLVKEDPKRLPVWMALMRLLTVTGPEGAARTVLDQALAALPDAPDLLIVKAGYLEQDGDVLGAIAIYEPLYKRDSANPILANNLASLLSGEIGEPGQAGTGQAGQAGQRPGGPDGRGRRHRGRDRSACRGPDGGGGPDPDRWDGGGPGGGGPGGGGPGRAGAGLDHRAAAARHHGARLCRHLRLARAPAGRQRRGAALSRDRRQGPARQRAGAVPPGRGLPRPLGPREGPRAICPRRGTGARDRQPPLRDERPQPRHHDPGPHRPGLTPRLHSAGTEGWPRGSGRGPDPRGGGAWRGVRPPPPPGAVGAVGQRFPGPRGVRGRKVLCGGGDMRHDRDRTTGRAGTRGGGPRRRPRTTGDPSSDRKTIMFHRPTRMLLAVLVLCAGALGVVDPAAAQSSYRIQPGDSLQFEVLEDASLNRSLLVLPDGTVSVPSVGSVKASGRSVDDLRADLIKDLAPGFANTPTVYLSVGQLAARREPTGAATGPTIAVFAMGEVSKPGRVDVSPGTTLLQFLAQSGGLTNFAATKRIQLRRTDRASGQDRVWIYDYNAVSRGGTAPSIRLLDGDVIVVPQRHLFE